MRRNQQNHVIDASEVQRPPKVNETQSAIGLYCAPSEIELIGFEPINDQETLERAARETIVTDMLIAQYHDSGETSPGLLDPKKIEEWTEKRIGHFEDIGFIGTSTLIHYKLGLLSPYIDKGEIPISRKLFSLRKDLPQLIDMARRVDASQST
jgi:hypothetical protein